MKETNNLLVTKKEEKYASSLKKLDLIPFPDGVLLTENYLMLQNFQTKGFLVLDTDDKNPNYDSAFAVTTSPTMNFGCPRSLFKIQKFTKNQNSQGVSEIVTYGEKVIIVSHPDCFQKTLFLQSSLIGPQSFSRFSRNQEVLVNGEKTYNSCWIIDHPDTTFRYSLEGKAVMINEPFILRHCATGRLLASDLVDYYNDFGLEYEVCANNFLSTNKYQTLVSEKSGKLKIDTKTRVEKEQNIWRFLDQ